MACKASCGGSVSTQPLYLSKVAPKPINSWLLCSAFCSTSNQLKGRSPLTRAICTSASSLTPNSGERRARASERSCCGETSTSSSATISSTSQQSISSVFSPICAGTCSLRSSSCKGIKPARLRDKTMMFNGFSPALICPAIQAAAWRASSVRRVSSGTSRGVVKLSRQPVSIVICSDSDSADWRAIGCNRQTLPGSFEALVCGRKPSKPSSALARAITWLTV